MPLDFTSVTASSVTTLTDRAVAEADALVAAVDARDPIPTLERAVTVIRDAGGSGAFMAKVHPESEVRDAASEAEERLDKWATDLTFRRPVYEALSTYAASEAAAALEGTGRRLLDHWLRDFRRAGHELDDAARTELQRMQNRLVELQVAFDRNLAEWEDGLELERSRLDGLPESYLDGLKTTEDGRFRVSLDYPDYVPFMQQATDRAARRDLQGKFWNRATDANRPLLEEAVGIRMAIARLLGYPTWADFAMEVKMAERPAAVEEFYASITPGLTAKADAELAVLTELHRETHPGERVESWDWNYLDDQQRRRDHGIDQNEVAAYFPLEAVVQGMFDLTGDVFGLEYRQLEDTRAWHPDVALYEIRDRGADRPIAFFYADLFPREGKYGHAAAFSIRYGMATADGYRPPMAAIVANFTKPTASAPSLLKHNEALTLFHEFGHILHFCLTTVAEARFAGYDTEWDFVEAPSQIMENWMWEPEILQRFARHHETGEPIPADLVARLVAARNLNIGLHGVRQIFLGKVDLGMHAVDHQVDLMDVYREAYAYTRLPFREDTFFPASFGHLMGGYDAGYYGYLWAEVYGDDMFSEFSRVGITSPEVGMRYRNEVLATGGSRDAIDHLRAFLGREPNSEAFLAKRGLTPA
jgi:thimet oligopeptidase